MTREFSMRFFPCLYFLSDTNDWKYNMNNQNVKYQETQNAFWLTIPMLVIIFFLILSYVNQWGDDPIPITATILTSLVFVIVILLFFKLTITITETNITAAFGFGLIKKSIELENINLQLLEEIKTPWYYGIGIRITPYGVLYNTKPGMALRLKYKNSEKEFLIGTENIEEIKKVLSK